MTLSVPIPIPKNRSIPIFMVWADPLKNPMKFRLDVPKEGKILDLKKELSKLVDLSEKELFVTEVYNSRFFKEFSDEDVLSPIRPDDKIYVHQIAAQPPLEEGEEEEEEEGFCFSVAYFLLPLAFLSLCLLLFPLVLFPFLIQQSPQASRHSTIIPLWWLIHGIINLWVWLLWIEFLPKQAEEVSHWEARENFACQGFEPKVQPSSVIWEAGGCVCAKGGDLSRVVDKGFVI